MRDFRGEKKTFMNSESLGRGKRLSGEGQRERQKVSDSDKDKQVQKRNREGRREREKLTLICSKRIT